MIHCAKVCFSVLKPLRCISILQTQRYKQNKNWNKGSGDITILKEKGMLSNLHNHTFVVYK
jgi:hypothetical protein